MGESIIGCQASAKPGAIWVHVTDDLGVNLEGVPVLTFPASNANGLSIRDPLAEDGYSVELDDPANSGFQKTHDFPPPRKRPVLVRNGAISYVNFILTRKAELVVSIVFKSSGKAFTAPGVDSSVRATFAGGPSPADQKSTDGDATFGLVPSGEYTITPTFSGGNVGKFQFETGPQTVTLAPGVAKRVKFEVAPLAHLSVEIAIKPSRAHPGPKRWLEDPVVTVRAERTGGNGPIFADTAKGVADFGWLLPGEYTIAPDFSPVPECEYDWPVDPQKVDLLEGEETLATFVVEPLYQQVQFIAHCLLTIPNQIFVPSAEDLISKVKVGAGVGGIRTFTYEERDVEQGLWAKNELVPPLPFAKAVILAKTDGSGTLTFKKKPQSNDFWDLADLDPDTLKPDRITVTPSTPPGNVYNIQFKQKVAKLPYGPSDLTGNWMAQYHGYRDDADDMTNRVAFVQDSLAKAAAKAIPKQTVLKVFMVPECFFQGIHGAYLESDAAILLEKLRQLVKGDEWEDWVFSFGTVNSLTPAAPTPGITYRPGLYEMKNRAPVIRGGLGDSSASAAGHTRLVQKLLNSAELADEATIQRDSTLSRREAVNDEVQFVATEEGITAGTFLAGLLHQETVDGSPGQLFLSKGLPAELWNDPTASGSNHGLLEEMRRVLSNWGMARVIREIRISDNAAVKSRPLAEWRFCSNESSSVVRKTCLLTVQQSTLLLVQTKWRALYPELPLLSTHWNDKANRWDAVIKQLVVDFQAVASACGFPLTQQQRPIKDEIDQLAGDEVQAKALIPSEAVRLLFRPSIFPLWRALLELYKEHLKSDVPLAFRKESLRFEDYCFAGPRKPGAWIPTLLDAKPLKACKRMVFGVEICADHANDRLVSLNTGPSSLEIDIQLVPSAGMRPAYYAARSGGYIFNCDGWNKKPEVGGKGIEYALDGPSPFAGINSDGYEFDITPVYPHSAVGKRTGGPKPVGACLEPDPGVVAAPLSEDLSRVIFGKGPGELHFYPIQDLPK